MHVFQLRTDESAALHCLCFINCTVLASALLRRTIPLFSVHLVFTYLRSLHLLSIKRQLWRCALRLSAYREGNILYTVQYIHEESA